MPIPSKEEIAEMEKHASEEVGLNSEWKVDVDVRPWLGADLSHEIKTEEKRIKILVYSARFPSTWFDWKDSCFKQLRRQLESLKEKGEIEEWKRPGEPEVDLTSKDWFGMDVEQLFEEIKTLSTKDPDGWDKVKKSLEEKTDINDDEELAELVTRLRAADIVELKWLYHKGIEHDVRW